MSPQKFLVLLSGCCLSLAFSEETTAAPTSICDSKPVDIFFWQHELYKESNANYQIILDENPTVAGPFQPIIDQSVSLTVEGVKSFETETGCVNPYPKPKTKNKKKSKRKGKSSEAKSETKVPKSAKKKDKRTEVPAELDIPALVLAGISDFSDDVYMFASFNQAEGPTWTYPFSLEGYDAVPERDVQIVATGSLTNLMCSYQVLVQRLVQIHALLTTTYVAQAYAAERGTFFMDLYDVKQGVDDICDECR